MKNVVTFAMFVLVSILMSSYGIADCGQIQVKRQRVRVVERVVEHVPQVRVRVVEKFVEPQCNVEVHEFRVQKQRGCNVQRNVQKNVVVERQGFFGRAVDFFRNRRVRVQRTFVREVN